MGPTAGLDVQEEKRILLSLLLAARSPSPQSSYYTDYSVPNPCQGNVNSNVKKNTANKLSPLICYTACEFLLDRPKNQITRGESNRVFEVSCVCVCVCVCKWVVGWEDGTVPCQRNCKTIGRSVGTVLYLI